MALRWFALGAVLTFVLADCLPVACRAIGGPVVQQVQTDPLVCRRKSIVRREARSSLSRKAFPSLFREWPLPRLYCASNMLDFLSERSDFNFRNF
jgi:hypothetical protein